MKIAAVAWLASTVPHSLFAELRHGGLTAMRFHRRRNRCIPNATLPPQLHVSRDQPNNQVFFWKDCVVGIKLNDSTHSRLVPRNMQPCLPLNPWSSRGTNYVQLYHCHGCTVQSCAGGVYLSVFLCSAVVIPVKCSILFSHLRRQAGACRQERRAHAKQTTPR